MIATIENLKRFCVEAFQASGMSEADSGLCADALVTADAMGYFSHGVANLSGYIEKSKACGVDFSASPEVILDLPSIAVINANNCLGMVPAAEAMRLACQKASSVGVAFVSVKNSSHFGAAGYFANIAASQGMIGVVLSNVDSNMAIPGSAGKAVGNNPIAIAAPANSVPSVFLDISTSATASLNVLRAKERGDLVPDGWLIDGCGVPTNNPERYPEEGALQPMGGHKGFGLSIMVECLTGVLTGAGTSIDGSIPSWCFSLEQANNISHAFIAIDVSAICSPEVYRDRLEGMIRSLHEVKMAKGHAPAHAPGEKAWERYTCALQAGISLSDETCEKLNALAEQLEIGPLPMV